MSLDNKASQNRSKREEDPSVITVTRYGSLLRIRRLPDNSYLCPICKSIVFYNIRDLINHIVTEH